MKMTRTVKQIYQDFRIPPNLQEHMLRVAALIGILVERWQGAELNYEATVRVGLFHDMGNLLKFDLSRTELLGKEARRVDYWRQVQQDMKAKYGPDVHKATLAIGREIGLPVKELELVEKLEWKLIDLRLAENDFESAVTIYADMRIGPFGIMTMEERIDDFRTRAKVTELPALIASSKRLERTIQASLNVRVNAIKESALKSRFESLLSLEI
jgi:HD superfamily phosphodiesterase